MTTTVGHGVLQFYDNSSAANATIDNAAGFVNFTGNSTAGNATVNIANGASVLLLGTSHAGAATFNVANGGLFEVNDAGDGGTSRLNVSSGGRVDISFVGLGNPAINSFTVGAVSGSGDFFLGSNKLVVGSLDVDSSLSGVIQDGGLNGGTGASLQKIGTGTLTLSGPNAYTGTTTVSAGTLATAAGNTLPGLTAVTVEAPGMLNFAGFNQSIGSLAGAGSVPLGSATLTTGNDNTSTDFSGVMSGSGALDKVGSGTFVLSGDNTYTGGTTIAAGTLQLSNGGTTGSITGNVTDNGTLAFDHNNVFTFGGAISGTGGLAQLGSGTTILTADNSYTGPTTINGGFLQAGAAISALGNNSAVTINAGTLDLHSFNETIGSLTGAGVVTLGSGTLTVGDNTSTAYAGTIIGTGGLDKVGTGTLTLSGNANLGGTTIEGGTLAVNAGTLNLGGGVAITQNLIVGQRGVGDSRSSNRWDGD